MPSVIAAVGQTKTIVVVDHGSGTSWWIPLAVALSAALVSYFATWRFKKADVNRESALRAVDLIDEAEQFVSYIDPNELDAPDAAVRKTLRLIQRARVRSQPLDDDELDDRFVAAISFLGDLLLMPWQRPGAGRHWLVEATANIREGLVPHLSAPRLFRTRRASDRSFPQKADVQQMARDSGGADELINKLTQCVVRGA